MSSFRLMAPIYNGIKSINSCNTPSLGLAIAKTVILRASCILSSRQFSQLSLSMIRRVGSGTLGWRRGEKSIAARDCFISVSKERCFVNVMKHQRSQCQRRNEVNTDLQ